MVCHRLHICCLWRPPVDASHHVPTDQHDFKRMSLRYDEPALLKDIETRLGHQVCLLVMNQHEYTDIVCRRLSRALDALHRNPFRALDDRPLGAISTRLRKAQPVWCGGANQLASLCPIQPASIPSLSSDLIIPSTPPELCCDSGTYCFGTPDPSHGARPEPPT